MTAICITANAAQRFIERVAPAMSIEQARAEIASHERAILAAARFGCPTVLLGNRARLILDGDHVVTVLGPGHRKGNLARGGDR